METLLVRCFRSSIQTILPKLSYRVVRFHFPLCVVIEVSLKKCSDCCCREIESCCPDKVKIPKQNKHDIFNFIAENIISEFCFAHCYCFLPLLLLSATATSYCYCLQINLQRMPQFISLRFKIKLVVLVRLNLQLYIVNNLQSIAHQSNTLLRIVCHQTQFTYTKIT